MTRAVAGIVRSARRPPGWSPSGPRPASPLPVQSRPAPGEDLCYLAGDFRILQRIGGHRWSLDDLLTADFAVSRQDLPPARFADLGCGIGSVLMMLAWRFPGAVGIGIEAQAQSVDLARRSLACNDLESRCRIHHGDLRENAIPEEPFDLMTATPPYFALGAATTSPDAQRFACRSEVRGGVESYCSAAGRLLRPRGRLVLCMPGERGGRVERAGREAGLVLEAGREVIPRDGRPPLFSLWSFLRQPRAIAPVWLPPLVVRDRAGLWTAEMRGIRRGMGMPHEDAGGGNGA